MHTLHLYTRLFNLRLRLLLTPFASSSLMRHITKSLYTHGGKVNYTKINLNGIAYTIPWYKAFVFVSEYFPHASVSKLVCLI